MSMFYLTNYDQLDVGQWHEVLMSDVEKIGCTLAGVLPKRIKPCWSMSLESWGHMGPYVATLFALCKNNRLFLDLDRNIKEHAKSVMILRDFFWEETGPPSSIHFPNEPSSPTFQTAHICHCHFTEMSLQRVKWPNLSSKIPILLRMRNKRTKQSNMDHLLAIAPQPMHWLTRKTSGNQEATFVRM